MTDQHSDEQVPFSPIPTEPGHRMKFHPDDSWEYEATPIRVAWEATYKDAAVRLSFGDDDGARRAARLGLDLEAAYIHRVTREPRTLPAPTCAAVDEAQP